MQMLALLSSFPPAAIRRDEKRCSPLALASQFATAVAIVAIVMIGLEITSRDRNGAASNMASLEQEF